MKGSEKQIKWAEDIKASKASEFAKIRKAVRNEIGTKALDYIEHNDNAAFWIDYRDRKVMDMLNDLCKGTLYIEGHIFGAAPRAKIDQTTGVITVSLRDLLTGIDATLATL